MSELIPKSRSEFEEMVLNRPAPDMPGYYELTVWRYSAECKGDFRFKRVNNTYRIPVGEYAWMGRVPETGIFTCMEDAIAAKDSLAGQPDIIAFEIEKFPYGVVGYQPDCIDSLQYDSEGRFVQRGSCSVHHYQTPGIYGKFFGHLLDKMPYKVGDIVTIIISSRKDSMKHAVLGVVVTQPKTIKEGFDDYKSAMKAWVREGNSPETWLEMDRYLGCDEDEYFIQFGAIDEYMTKFIFINPMAVMPAPDNLPEKVKSDLMSWYSEYLELMRREEEEEKAVTDRMCEESMRNKPETNQEPT